jgi:F-type H+-transporting ATPase subunit b
MTRRGVWKAIASAFVILLLAVVSAHAAEEGGNATTERATEIFKWINFAIVVALTVWVSAKFIRPFFRKNAETISSAINQSMAAKAEAERQLREAEEKLARLEKEVAELRATAQRESAAEAERLRAATQADLEKIRLAARAEIEAAERAARLELKAIAGNLAVDQAELLLKEELTPQAQESLVAEFVQSLAGRPN